MKKNELSPRQTWSAVGSMALCVSMLIGAPRLFDAIPRGRWRTPQGKDKS